MQLFGMIIELMIFARNILKSLIIIKITFCIKLDFQLILTSQVSKSDGNKNF